MFRQKVCRKIIPGAILAVFFVCSPGLCAEKELEKKLSEIEKATIADGAYEESIEKLTVLLQDHPDNSRIYMDLGLAHYGNMEYVKAYGYFKKSNELGPKREHKEILDYIISKIDENRDVLWEIEGAKNSLEGSAEAARAELEDTIATGHIAVITELQKEKYYYPAVVIAHILWLKENMPGSPEIYRFSADVYYTAMLYGKAREDYEKTIEYEPLNAELHQTLADCLVALGDFDSAQEYYEKTIELYQKQGLKKNDPMIVRLEKIKKALPKRYKDIAELVKEKRYQEAEDICRKRLSLNPGDIAAIAQLGQVYWEKGNRRGAIKLFRRAIKIAPDYPTAHFFLGRAYVFEKKPKKGIAEFDIFKEKMELLPKMDEDTVDFYVSALHYISYMYSTLREYKKVEKECKKIIELKPDDQDAHYNLAVVYYQHYHSLSRTFNELRKVVEIDPNTKRANWAEYYMDYIRRNPDSRFVSDFTFIYEEE